MNNYTQFYERNGIEYSDTRLVRDSNGNEAKNGSREIPWELHQGKYDLAQAKAYALIERFGIKEDEKGTFIERFKEATSGDGGELKRITTLHSSALLALMCFWRVDGNHPIHIDGVDYTKVFFECHNMVINGRKPSNVDVVLVSKDETTILFLESKFTEFYHPGKVMLAAPYRPFYDELVKLWEGSLTISGEPGEEFALNLINPKRGEAEYLAGIKQMVSHIIGVMRGPEISQATEEYKQAFKKSSKIIVGTILYYPPQTDDGKKYHRYVRLYHKRIGKIGSDIISVIKKVLSDQLDEVKQIKIEPNAMYYIAPKSLNYQDIFCLNRELLLESVVKTYFSKQFIPK